MCLPGITLIGITLTFSSLTSIASDNLQRVLYLGDSMSMGAFGQTLDQKMRESGCEVYTYVSGGATPYYWLSRYPSMSSNIGHWEKTPTSERKLKAIKGIPKIEALIRKHEPTIVVVQTGTNLYATLRSKRRTKKENIAEVEKLVDNMARACTQNNEALFWITPPKSHPNRYPESLQEEMADIMKRVVGKYGTVYDSRNVTEFVDPYPKTDGVHYGPAEATAWANMVANNFQNYRLQIHDRLPSNRVLLASNDPETVQAIAVKEVRRVSKNSSDLAAKEKPIELAMNTGPNVTETPSTFLAKKGRDLASTKPAPRERIVEIESSPNQPAPNLPKRTILRATPVSTKWGPVVATLRLKEKSFINHLNDVTYHHCLVLYEYDVISLDSGEYPYDVIRIAETAVWNEKPMRALKYEIGMVRSLKLDPLSDYPSLEQWQLNDDLSVRPELPVYIPSMK